MISMKYLDTKQTALLLNISHRTLERWRVEGNGPEYRKFGARVAYEEASLISWAEKQKRTSTSDICITCSGS